MLRDPFSLEDTILLQYHTPHAQDLGRQALVARHIRSEWPISLISLGEDAEKKRFESLIDGYQELAPEESSSEATSSKTKTPDAAG